MFRCRQARRGGTVVAAAFPVLVSTALALLALAVPVRAQAPAAAWQRTDLRPVTQPAPAAGLLVLYVSQNGGLRVVAVDPQTGRTVWSRLASPSSIAPGEARPS